MRVTLFTVTVALALLETPVEAFWRLECEGISGLARMDPLMAYDAIGDHVHSIKGASGKLPPNEPLMIDVR